MKTTDSYLLAERGDYQRLQKFAPDEDGFTFPTVVARRAEQIIGFAATNPHPKHLVLGRAWVSPELRVPGIIMVRLLEAYDRVAVLLKQTSYAIVVEQGDKIEKHLLDFEFATLYAERGVYRYYRRDLHAKKEAA